MLFYFTRLSGVVYKIYTEKIQINGRSVATSETKLPNRCIHLFKLIFIDFCLMLLLNEIDCLPIRYINGDKQKKKQS